MKDKDDPELQTLRVLIKSVSGKDFDSVKWLQENIKLPKFDDAGKATLHVGRGNSNIDLAVEDSLLDVTNSNFSESNLQVCRLSRQSQWLPRSLFLAGHQQ